MKYVPLGISYDTANPIAGPLDAEMFAGRITASLAARAGLMATIGAARGAVPGDSLAPGGPDVRDPLAAGWTYLVHADDPDRVGITRALATLAAHRGMPAPTKPLLFDAGIDDLGSWFDWQLDHYDSLESPPQYVMIVGGPEAIPFGFQAQFGCSPTTTVGRVAFDSVEELAAYADKVVRLETGPPVVDPEVVVFAPDEGKPGATYFSRTYMAEPIAALAAQRPGFQARLIGGDDATKDRLVETLTGSRPAVVYTASHGLAVPMSSKMAVQRQLNGAICCQPTGHDVTIRDRVFAADDVPGDDEPFCEGAVFFQFACFGYGTPAVSEYAHWDDGVNELNTEHDFVAALPKRMLAHPRGPVAYIGHVDLAWLHGFDDVDAPGGEAAWNPRLAPFRTALERLLGPMPAGLALGRMTGRYGQLSAELARTYQKIDTDEFVLTTERRERLANTFITRNDAQNHLVFGDPAALIRLP